MSEYWRAAAPVDGTLARRFIAGAVEVEVVRRRFNLASRAVDVPEERVRKERVDVELETVPREKRPPRGIPINRIVGGMPQPRGAARAGP